MNRHIEQTDKGIVISKALAWTIIVSVLSGGFVVGMQIATMSTAVENLGSRFDTMEVRAVETERRVRDIERNDERTNVILENQTELLQRIDNRISELSGRLREQERNRFEP